MMIIAGPGDHPNAVVQAVQLVSTLSFNPSIRECPMPVVVQDAGLLSPGFFVGELVPPLADPYSLRFSTISPLIWLSKHFRTER